MPQVRKPIVTIQWSSSKSISLTSHTFYMFPINSGRRFESRPLHDREIPSVIVVKVRHGVNLRILNILTCHTLLNCPLGGTAYPYITHLDATEKVEKVVEDWVLRHDFCSHWNLHR